MCGIFGIISPELTRDQLEKATSTLHHRGPDDSGFFIRIESGLVTGDWVVPTKQCRFEKSVTYEVLGP